MFDAVFAKAARGALDRTIRMPEVDRIRADPEIDQCAAGLHATEIVAEGESSVVGSVMSNSAIALPRS